MLEPLGSLLRPQSLEGFVGQNHIVGDGKSVRTFIESGTIPSMIFRGPPGCGKTTLAIIISKAIKADFFQLSGVRSKKEDLNNIIQRAQVNFRMNTASIVFLDEIHRWNKAQQDGLLPFVEKGIITLIGATTENPSFTVINALLSRCRVFVFEKITEDEINTFLNNNLKKINGKFPEVKFSKKAIKIVSGFGNGDLRSTLNLVETICILKKKGSVTKKDIFEAGEKMVYYDRDQEEHYNIISAVHKSLRDSDADAACYWIQRMLSGGEDPLYIARRLLRFASEDIGPANNNALLLANTVYESIQKIGMPECDVFLFQLAIYLAQSKKNNIAYKVAGLTKQDVEKFGNLSVPIHLRNASTKLMKELGYGKDYKYAHDYKDAKIEQEHFPKELKGRKYGIGG